MTIDFIPQGIPLSSSLAKEAKYALNSGNTPDTASTAEFSVGDAGPTGPDYVTISGSRVTVT